MSMSVYGYDFCKYVIKGILVHSCAATPISWRWTELMLLCQVGIIAAHN